MAGTRRDAPRAPLADSLRIHIIGAGMGGMSAALALAHNGFQHIHVWESAHSLGEVGAGINITPNMSRILDRWGVLPIATEEATALSSASVLNCATDSELTSVDFAYIKQDFGYPFYTVHRASLQKALVTGALESGTVKLHLGHQVSEFDFEGTRFLAQKRVSEGQNPQDPQWIQADVILAADGIKSKARSHMLQRQGQSDDVTDTGQAAYRILVDREKIQEDPELVPFFEGSHSYRWIGEKRHIIAYPICSHKVFNMSTAHPDRNFVQADTWTATGSKEEMLSTFHDFCPRVQKLLRLVPEGDVMEWKLRVHSPVACWVDHQCCLVGDACHPTLPHLAQGAAQAVEDGAVLGEVLAQIDDVKDINKALRVYQELRKPRADWAVREAANNGKGLHMSSGRSQEERDRLFKSASKMGGSNPDKAIDKQIQSILYAHDCVAEVGERFKDLFAAV